MPEKLYGVRVNHVTNKIIVESIRILKETSKTYKIIGPSIDWYGYKQVINKSDSSIAFSKEIAVKLFINQQEIELDRARNTVAYILEQIERAKSIIYRDSGNHK